MVKNQYFSQLSSKSSEKTSLFLKNGFFFKQCTKLREVAGPYFSTPPGGCPGTRMLMPCVHHTPSRYSIKLNSLFQTLIYFVLNISPIRVQIKPEVFRRLEAWGQQLFGREDGVLRRRTSFVTSCFSSIRFRVLIRGDVRLHTASPERADHTHQKSRGDKPEQPAWLTLHVPGRHSIPSAAFLAGTSIYVMLPDPGREWGWEEGRRRETALQAARPSAHAATIQRMSRKPVRCHCTDPNAAHARMHTCTPPKEHCRRQNCLWKGESL